MESYAPFLSRRFDLALQLASGLHHDQCRKGSSIPYIAHLLNVCALVLEAGGDEDQAIAALLHDAVEDQGGLPTLATIRHMFGDRVANTVESCSDSTVTNPAEKPPWHERKRAYLDHLRIANQDTLMVATADKVHNARTLLSDRRQIGECVWAKFNAPKGDQLWFYVSLLDVLEHSPDAPKTLVHDLAAVVDELKRLPEMATERPYIYLSKDAKERVLDETRRSLEINAKVREKPKGKIQ